MQNKTLYSPKYNFEFYNIHKNAQTSILNTFNHPNKKDKDRIEWHITKDLPKNRITLCIIRDVYNRAISSYLYIIHRLNPSFNFRILSIEKILNIYHNKNILNGFEYYLKEIKQNGHFNNHSLSQLDFLDNTIKRKYGDYMLSSDRDVKNITHYIKFEEVNEKIKKLFNVELKRDNQNRINYKKYIKQNIEKYKNLIEHIYKDDIEFINNIKFYY